MSAITSIDTTVAEARSRAWIYQVSYQVGGGRAGRLEWSFTEPLTRTEQLRYIEACLSKGFGAPVSVVAWRLESEPGESDDIEFVSALDTTIALFEHEASQPDYDPRELVKQLLRRLYEARDVLASL